MTDHKKYKVGIALDTSGSMNSILEDVTGETIKLLDELKPEEVVFCTFSSKISCDTFHLEDAKEKLVNAEAEGFTAMYDGVTTMLREMIKLSSDTNFEIVAIIVTDGFENASVEYTKKDLEDAKKKLREVTGNDDCIQEICISSTLEEATSLRDSTPGLLPARSAIATRDTTSISVAFDSIRRSDLSRNTTTRRN